MDETTLARRKRKDEAKRLKRQRITESGGVRPRKKAYSSQAKRNESRKPHSSTEGGKSRFGRVMEKVPCRNRPRFSTVSIALPGSIVANCQTRELKTQISGQIARYATIYHVDEIVVFDDKLGKSDRWPAGKEEDEIQNKQRFSEPHALLARILQFLECPQYLRRHFFPIHPGSFPYGQRRRL